MQERLLGLVLKVGATIVRGQIDPFPINLCIVPTHTIHSFMQRQKF
jgi:hypothetical protein